MILIVAYIALIIVLKFKMDMNEKVADTESQDDSLLKTKD